MSTTLPRRRFLACASAAVILPPAIAAGHATQSPSATTPTLPHLLSQDPAVVQQMVGASHGNIAVVRELIARQPALVNAATDWGFGDWESAIDAASHVGNTEMALFLIERGARPTIFTLAMLGHLDGVRAMIVAFPGIQRTRGPHGFNLMHHARVGREQSSATLAYLEELGDADPQDDGILLTPENAGPYLGSYSFGPHETDRIEIVNQKDKIGLRRAGGGVRYLREVDPHTFFPTGAPAVRIRFTVVDGAATSVAFLDPDVILTAQRISG